MGTLQEEWRLENARGTLRLTEVGLSTLVLVNGAAASVLLNFFSTFRGADQARHALRGALMAFSHGVLAAVIAMIFAWTYQRVITRTDNDQKALPYLIIGLVLVLLSAGEFANGLYLAGAALE